MTFTSVRSQKLKSKMHNSDKGFSLFEVLIALALTAIMLGVLVGGTFTESQRLDDALVDMEKAVRFSADEAILRNKIIRIHFRLDKNPQEYTVEYGPSSSFVLPAFVADKEEEENLSLEETEKRAKDKAALDKKFNKVQEFEEGAQGLPDSVKIVAVGTDLQEKLILDGSTSIYVYPTGQKDGAIIFLGTSEEVVALKLSPFFPDIEKEYVTLDGVNAEELDEMQIQVAQKLFEKWLKE